jgi:hypothetical protein
MVLLSLPVFGLVVGPMAYSNDRQLAQNSVVGGEILIIYLFFFGERALSRPFDACDPPANLLSLNMLTGWPILLKGVETGIQ